jgi:SAM-dependent methyltransferase
MTEPLYDDRDRALSFGTIAERYDRFRPDYPAALIDDLAALRPRLTLDAGCGTGKAAVALAGRGLAVLGIEPDVRMANTARRHGIEVEVASFEDWDAAGREADLIVSGEAWHWIDPLAGAAKAAAVLRPGGTIARFWTTSLLVEAAALDEAYDRHAPGVSRVWRPGVAVPRFHTTRPDPFANNPSFEPATLHTYAWTHTYTTDEWLGRAATISDHQRLGEARLSNLLSALRTAITTQGGTLTAENETYALLNRKHAP